MSSVPLFLNFNAFLLIKSILFFIFYVLLTPEVWMGITKAINNM